MSKLSNSFATLVGRSLISTISLMLKDFFGWFIISSIKVFLTFKFSFISFFNFFGMFSFLILLSLILLSLILSFFASFALLLTTVPSQNSIFIICYLYNSILLQYAYTIKTYFCLYF